MSATACFSEPTNVGGGTEADDSTDGAADDGTTGANEESSDDDGGTEGDASDDDAGYPAEVTDVLDLPFPPANYADPALPDHFRSAAVGDLDNAPADNPITDDGATLGRVLFYDTLLSANETTACASCHHQDLGFTDDLAFSEGFEGGATGRNSMQIANARWYANGRFFWDERADTLEDQVTMPIEDPVEMGLTLDELVERVSAQPYYPPLFERAFGDSTVDAGRISAALAQFVRSIVSYRTRFDEGVAMTGDPVAPFPNFNADENRGKEIFFGPTGGCAACHVGNDGPPPPPGMPPGNLAIFQPVMATNNGLDAMPNADNGVGDQSGVPQDDGLFKVPTLRNVALTGPFMHDGRFETLAEVVEHYDANVQPHPNLDPRLQVPGVGEPRRLNLSPADRLALVAFLETLTDEAMLDDPIYADPFR
ncbi:MAG: cytochrome c peroxidase [Myxococcota bacterium]